MKAILFDHPGAPDVLYLGEAPAPTLDLDEIRISVTATAVNRADLLQRRGLYPPPQGASSILGLEAAGVITELGANAYGQGFSLGQRVMALLAGGGYAEQVTVPFGQVMPIPEGMSLSEAAAIPEAFLTAYLNLFLLGQLPWGHSDRPKSVLIHGGASGVGTAAISLCRENGHQILCTVGSAERGQRCKELGAHFAWNYHEGDFTAPVLAFTEQHGVDVILDCIGGNYLQSNLKVLAEDGKFICIGLQGGDEGAIDLGRMLSHRLQLLGSTLRGLPLARKASLVHLFTRQILPWFGQGRLRPIIHQIFPLAQAAQAHQALDQPHVGKIVLNVATN